MISAFEAQQRRKAAEPPSRDWATTREAILAARIDGGGDTGPLEFPERPARDEY